MKIIVVGLGQIGQEIAKELIAKNHDVTVIDTNKDLVNSFTNKYEAIGIVGSGASKEIQLQAKCNYSDVVIALTPTDEINLLCCLTAKHLGTKFTIATVKNLEYQNNDEYLNSKLGIDLVINSDQSTAEEITRVIGYPSKIKVEPFTENKINMAEITIREDSPLINLTIESIKEKYKNKINIVSVTRKNKLIIPNSDFKLEIGDTIYVLASTIRLHKFLNKIKLINKPVKNVLMIGCGNIGKKLTNNLLNMNIKVKIIEFDLKKCQELSDEFPNVDVVYGDGLNSELLIEEGIKNFDCCVSLTGSDESNLVVSMFAWSCEVRKVVTKISSIPYTSMLHNVKIDTTVSPHLTILNSIVKYVRSIKECVNQNSSLKTLYRFANNTAEAIEFIISDECEYLGISFDKLSVKPDIQIALIVRQKNVIIPTSEDCLEKGDKVIIIAKSDIGISDISDIFGSKN